MWRVTAYLSCNKFFTDARVNINIYTLRLHPTRTYYCNNNTNDDAPPYSIAHTEPHTRPSPLHTLIATTIARTNQTKKSKQKWLFIKIHKGDNLTNIFKRFKLHYHTLQQITAQKLVQTQLIHILPDQPLQLLVDDKNNLQQLIYQINPYDHLIVKRIGTSDKFTNKITHTTPKQYQIHRRTVIKHSLFETADRLGIPEKETMELTNIFDWDIDFSRNVHQGDQFNILYNSYYINGKKIHDGHIIAAQFVNRGKTYTAIRFTNRKNKTGYYTLSGFNLQRSFLRAPVKYTRISSRFTQKRKHPVLHRIRPHHGVDFAAPYGTPIRATGDGRIYFIGRKGGYGNAIIIQHNRHYMTLYGHMQRFAHKLHKKSKVIQGQIIGYVGSTGLATGPHVHYEFRVNGIHRDPLTIQFTQGKRLTRTDLTQFKHHAKEMINALNKTSV